MQANNDRLIPSEHIKASHRPVLGEAIAEPDSGWTWYASEFDGEDIFFGWVDGLEQELGYFSLAELQAATGPFGLHIERAIDFEPTRLSEVKRMHRRAG